MNKIFSDKSGKEIGQDDEYKRATVCIVRKDQESFLESYDMTMDEGSDLAILIELFLDGAIGVNHNMKKYNHVVRVDRRDSSEVSIGFEFGHGFKREK